MYIRSTKLRKLAALTLAVLFALTLLPVGAVTAAEGDPPEVQIGVETFAAPEFVSGLVPEEYFLTYPAPPRATRGAPPVPSYDARDEYISSVKNQGANGLCWAFSMYGAVEANMLINGYSERDLSELHMAYATSNSSGNTAQGFTRSPSGAGNRYYSSAYLMRGTDLSGSYSSEGYLGATSSRQDAGVPKSTTRLRMKPPARWYFRFTVLQIQTLP